MKKQRIQTFFTGLLLGTLLMILTIPFVQISSFWPLIQANATEVGDEISSQETQIRDTTYVSFSDKVVQSIEEVSDAVVGVINIRQTDLWSTPNKSGTGSGVIYKKQNGSAYIVTNNHVIRNAKEIEVMLSSGIRVPATLLGSDPLTDLAVLKINDDKVTTVAEFGSSENLRPGEPAIAIGNPLGSDFAGTATLGIISGLERTIPIDLNGDGQEDWQTDVLQTDAAINPGNSGGALININGKVIGINSMKIAQEAVEGIGFAIPVSIAKPIINDLETNGDVKRPFLGIESQALANVPTYHWTKTLELPEQVKEGVVILRTVPSSPAEEANLQKYDVIVALDDQPITSLIDLRKYLYKEKEIGDDLEVTYYRSGKKQTVSLTLSKQESAK